MGAFDGKKGLILGVANDHSIAWAIARAVMSEGAQCGFTHLPDRPDDERQRNRRRVAILTDKEPAAKFLVPLDVTNDKQIAETMTYFGGEKAVPGYNVMGICKAALDSCVKYLAYDLGPRGIRVNALSAGPLRTLAARGAGVEDMLQFYEKVAPLGRNVTHDEVGRTGAFLLSPLSNGITGEVLHVDCGYNIMGTPGRMLEQFKK